MFGTAEVREHVSLKRLADNVGGLDVSVTDVLAVDVGQPSQELHQDHHYLSLHEVLVFEESLLELFRKVEVPGYFCGVAQSTLIIFEHVLQGGHVWMVE